MRQTELRVFLWEADWKDMPKDWVYINITIETRDKLRALADEDGYVTPSSLLRRLVDEEFKRRTAQGELGTTSEMGTESP